MKRLITLLIIIFQIDGTFAQARLNSTFMEIKQEFQSSNFPVRVDRAGDDNPFIVVTFDNRDVMYLFNDAMFCKMTIVIPKSTGAIQWLIEKYNQELTIISPTKWRFYKNGIYSNITFENREGLDLFIWEVVD